MCVCVLDIYRTAHGRGSVSVSVSVTCTVSVTVCVARYAYYRTCKAYKGVTVSKLMVVYLDTYGFTSYLIDALLYGTATL